MATENLLEFTDVSLQLRHDSAAAWTNENPVLLEGEIGIEVHPTDAKLNKFKIGDGTKAWNDLSYTYDRVELMNAILASVPKGCKVYRVEKLDAGASDESVLPDDTKVTVNNGDIAIVTTKITPTGATSAVELQKSAYIYDDTLVEKEVKVQKEVDGETVEVIEKKMLPLGWVAMTGNVDASKVIIRSDIKLAGDYTRVGNITKSSNSATADYKSSGMSVQTLLTEMLSQELQPKITSSPSVSSVTTYINGSKVTSNKTGASGYEVGTKIIFRGDAAFEDGAYTYSSTTGCKATGYTTKLLKGGTTNSGGTAIETKTAQSSTFTEISIENVNYKLESTISYSVGDVAKTNLGNDSGLKDGTSKIQISAGTTGAKYGISVTGYVPVYTYVGTDLSEINEAWFRTSTGALNKPTARYVDQSTWQIPELTIPDGTKRVLIAIPRALGTTNIKKSFSYIKDDAGLGTDVKANFLADETNLTPKMQLAITGLNNFNLGGTKITYDIFYCENTNGLSPTKYTFTMATQKV